MKRKNLAELHPPLVTFGDLSCALEQACQTQTPVRAAHWVLTLEKLTAGHSLEKHATLCHFRHILSNFILKRTKISHILFIIYSFKWKCGLNSLHRAALNKQWGCMRPACRQFDKPALECQWMASSCKLLKII